MSDIKIRNISMLIVFIFWITLVCIFFIFAFLYQKNHKDFRELRSKMIEELKDTSYKTSKIKIKLEDVPLLTGEYYLLKKDQLLYSMTYKTRFLRKMATEPIDNKFFIFSDSFKVNPKNSPIIIKSLYITNYNIIIEEEEEYRVLPFNVIKKLFYTISRIEDKWQRSIYILKDDVCYKIYFDDLQIMYTLREVYSKYIEVKNGK